jgi:deoxyribonuclease I
LRFVSLLWQKAARSYSEGFALPASTFHHRVSAPSPRFREDPYAGLSDQLLVDEIRRQELPHESLGYRTARKALFNTLDVNGGVVTDVYTGRSWHVNGALPDPNDLNVEHTWPRSALESSAASSDLHHLFPCDSDANNFRGNLPFGEVVESNWSEGGALRGEDASGDTVFEPPDAHKGNVARALFYMASVYDMDIPPEEEAVLREWHVADPVDARERRRNEAIERLQANRNPFIDRPELEARISDF